MEISDDLEGARLTLQLWPGGQVHCVGRADFHGRRVSLADIPRLTVLDSFKDKRMQCRAKA